MLTRLQITVLKYKNNNSVLHHIMKENLGFLIKIYTF